MRIAADSEILAPHQLQKSSGAISNSFNFAIDRQSFFQQKLIKLLEVLTIT